MFSFHHNSELPGPLFSSPIIFSYTFHQKPVWWGFSLLNWFFHQQHCVKERNTILAKCFLNQRNFEFSTVVFKDSQFWGGSMCTFFLTLLFLQVVQTYYLTRLQIVSPIQRSQIIKFSLWSHFAFRTLDRVILWGGSKSVESLPLQWLQHSSPSNIGLLLNCPCLIGLLGFGFFSTVLFVIGDRRQWKNS